MDIREIKYVSYIKGRYPQLDITKVECNFTDGLHGDIVTVNEKDVYKFARYDWSAGYIENEVKIINAIGGDISIHIPKAEPVEKGIGKFSFIKGEPLYRNVLLQMGNRIQEMVAEQLATFLKQLHSISLRSEALKNLPDCQATMAQEDWLIKYEEIERKVFPYCDSYTKEYFRQILRPLTEDEKFMDYTPALIHGDLIPNHMIFNKNTGRISGIVDFGLAGRGDPAYDIGIILDNFGEAFVKRMSRYYKNIITYIDRARFYAYVNTLLWARTVSDMIATRDFTNFRFPAKDRDIMPIGTKWSDLKG